ncbi:homoserine kinase [Lipingzhangella sp. LS1_29]|uniref:Homoserine kinase n=1 Tax=Lipingzhangella rawalii TaxID=2055835 RepID=A0ABU2H5T5_9ACTN|nr:homoserine kinase [Lipingzhangella rawalii]MDS1270674.1 homoserine kinase [Lipingzhangella rawalii]
MVQRQSQREPTPERIRVPATSANLGPGFDTMGLALQLYDEVEVRPAESGQLTVSVEGYGAGEVPLDERHLVLRSLRAAARALGEDVPAAHLHCVNRIPHGRGLGSSAAAIVAGVSAAQLLLGRTTGGKVDRDRVFAVAAELEGHPDNVAPCVYGGFTLAWADAHGWRCRRQDPAAGVSPVACVPTEQLSTEQARGLLPETVPHADAARTAGRAALLSLALTQAPELLLEATEDWLHQPYRGAAMPKSVRLLRTLREEARLPAVISGAGPTVLVLGAPSPTDGADPAQRGDLGDWIGGWAGTNWHICPVPVDTAGVATSVHTSAAPFGMPVELP